MSINNSEQAKSNRGKSDHSHAKLHDSVVMLIRTQKISIKNIEYKPDLQELQEQKLSEDEPQMSVLSNRSSQIQQKIPSEMRKFLRQKRQVAMSILKQHNADVQVLKQSITKPLKSSFKPNQTQNQLIQQPQYQIDLNHIKNQNQIVISQAPFRQHHQQQMGRKYSLKRRLTPIQPIMQTCQICEGKLQDKMSQLPVFTPCNHVFCQDCTTSYIRYKIKMLEQVQCPHQNCQAFINTQTEFYCKQFTLNERKQYQKLSRFLTLNKDNQNGKFRKLCPRQDCQGIVEVENDQTVLQCKACKLNFCSKCSLKPHQGECNSFELTYMKQNLNLVQCNKCKNFIQKTQGCNHISCKCGYEFCQKCFESWKKGHICKYQGLRKAEQGRGGCDWGLTKRDHCLFIIKLPLKFILISLCSLFWIMISCLAFPLNVIVILYWLYLLLLRPSIDYFKRQDKVWKLFLSIVLFPCLIIYCLQNGFTTLINHIDSFLPEVTNSFRWIIRI